MSAAALAIADLLLTAGINYLMQSQKVNAVIAQARASGRDVTPEELDRLLNERNRMSTEVDALLAQAALNGR